MTYKERVLALRLKEKLEKNPEYANRIGVEIALIRSEERKKNYVSD